MLAQLRQVCPDEVYDRGVPVVRNEVARFCSRFYERWEKCGKTLAVFSSHYAGWLNGEVLFETKEKVKNVKSPKQVGRPSKLFDTSTTRSKRRKVETLREKHSAVELLFAAATQFRADGENHMAKLLQMLYDSPQTAVQVLNAYKNSNACISPTKLSPEKAVSVIIEADLSKAQYLLLRSVAKNHQADIFPSYETVLEAKNKAYPSPESVKVTGTSAEVKLQNLLDLNASRIVEVLEAKGELDSLQQSELEMSHKWGCDGSDGHPQHKHKSSNDLHADKAILLTAIVPLQLKVCNEPDQPAVWTNASPSSTRYCQPLRLQFIKESKESLKEAEKHITDQIEQLQPSIVVLKNGSTLKIHHRLSMTMIDGKARNILTDTSSMATCCACGATPTAMSVSSVVQRPVNPEVFKYGISVLHARIRFMECVLHVAYKMDVKKWSANKSLYQDRKIKKIKIQNDLRTELGILVDVIKQGSGSTNDGNTSRRFFENPEAVAAITGFDQELLERFSTILTTLASGHEIDTKEFRVYARETAERFEEKYPWYYMPASIHFILIHGADVMDHGASNGCVFRRSFGGAPQKYKIISGVQNPENFERSDNDGLIQQTTAYRRHCVLFLQINETEKSR
jgi:hypothetical protein